MDNQRLFLFIALAMVVMLLWQTWLQDYGDQPAPPSAVESSPLPSIPQKDISGTQLPAPSKGQTPTLPSLPVTGLKTGERIHIVTDVLDIEVDANGGDLRQVELLDYPVTVDKPDQPFRLLKDTRPGLFIAQTGLDAVQGSAPGHLARLSHEKTEYRLRAGENNLKVPLRWVSDDGDIEVIKTYTFYRGRYDVDVDYTLHNRSNADWQGRQYRQFQRSRDDDGNDSAFIYTYTGGVIYSEENKYEKIDFDEMEDRDLERELSGGWAAMIQHYFVGAWIPPQDELNLYYSRSLGDERFVLGLVSPMKTIGPGQQGEFHNQLFVGPKLQNRMEALAPGLELTVDYGVLTVLAKPLFWLLEFIHGGVNNWGWSIVLLTLLIKLAFYKLSEASYRSMANMRRVQPRMVAIKERFGSDRQRMSQAMMELYKKEKINPLGGCLPMLVQIPVFIALYWALLESVELRQAPFILWIHDLSTKDPYYVLPLLMGGSMFIQMQLSPPPPDPLQAKIMKFLPIIFTGFFAFFPSGLVLYWVVNNVLSITQQWYITRRIEKMSRPSS